MNDERDDELRKADYVSLWALNEIYRIICLVNYIHKGIGLSSARIKAFKELERVVKRVSEEVIAEMRGDK